MGGIESTKERIRLVEYQDKKKQMNWKLWGPYLSERQWGTVREDYSASGNAWEEFSRWSARYRAYRWGEDGIAGISDDRQRLCFSLALWNGADECIKERLFGLTNGEGNKGEDVKEYYYYLDSTPTHSYMKYLYKYPHEAFPYKELLDKRESISPFEYELVDTGIFKDDKYFDVLVEYAKGSPDDILVNITVTNRYADKERKKELILLPTLWFRNAWSWVPVESQDPKVEIPRLEIASAQGGMPTIKGTTNCELNQRWLYCQGAPEVVFTDNETNKAALGWCEKNEPGKFYKDGIDNYVRNKDTGADAVNRERGTKAAAVYTLTLGGGESATVRLRLTDRELSDPFGEFEATLKTRKAEADEFYQAVSAAAADSDLYNIQRQAFAGMLWNKQLYYYVVRDWLEGDDPKAPPPPERNGKRNGSWTQLYSNDILSMPDKWEYPWFAAWDLAFHTVTLAMIDPDFAKSQLLFLVMEWYMHPNGQMPAYEWDFSNVNPPVQAWAAWNVYQREKSMNGGKGDVEFLQRIFNKLNMNFTWWVNKQDVFCNNIFEGGFLGMDNIRLVDNSSAGGTIEQADGTAWMAMYSLYMLAIATELVNEGENSYRDSLRKYFQHFLYISLAINNIGGDGLWDEKDGFYFDKVRVQDSQSGTPKTETLRVFSLTGLIPLLAIANIRVNTVDQDSFLNFQHTYSWFVKNRGDLTKHPNIYYERKDAHEGLDGKSFEITLSIVSPDRLKQILDKLLDRGHFLADYGIRSLSMCHKDPYYFNGQEIRYEPAESEKKIMGGNSNWRGPVWFPINYLLIDALRKFHHYLDSEITVEHAPLGSDTKQKMNLELVANDLAQRLVSIFQRDSTMKRPVFGDKPFFDKDPHDPVLFYEYFHPECGAGIGASHQTGWTGLVANLIDELKR